jgi:hypothetical protein
LATAVGVVESVTPVRGDLGERRKHVGAASAVAAGQNPLRLAQDGVGEVADLAALPGRLEKSGGGGELFGVVPHQEATRTKRRTRTLVWSQRPQNAMPMSGGAVCRPLDRRC